MKKISIVIIAVFVVVAAFLFAAATQIRLKSNVEVDIPQGASTAKIAVILYSKGVIRTPMLFELAARISGKKFRAGNYEFPEGSNFVSVFKKLVRGDVKQYPFTVIEGWNIKDIATALVGKSFLASPEEPLKFVELTTDPNYIASLGFTGLSTLEGYLFPDTYFLAKTMTAEAIIKRMLTRFNDVWSSLDKAAIASSGLTPAQIVTLASIVEKETGSAEERPLVASVFLNRLKLGMPLQSDPTIIYGLPDFDGNIRKSDITDPHPYNTYVHKGLPPGPIANPGKASIEAVLWPAPTKYLYFVSMNNGTHKFSETLAEHSKAVQEFQRR